MKTVVWKELREHACWVPVAAAVMAVVLVLQWRRDALVFDGASLASLVGLVACAVAAALGWAQSWGDRRPAARALLLHRGISADAAFCGKLLAGIVLYSVAVFVPLLCMAAFIAAHGIEHRAASPGALLPSAFLSLTAFCCWPAAMLIAQREARFAGSRLAPALAAGFAAISGGVLVDSMLWFATTTAAVMMVALVAAARGVFVNGSHLRSAGGRAGLAVVVTFSLFVLMTFVWMMVESQRIRRTQSTAPDVYQQSTVELGPDGRPWLTQSQYSQVTYEYEPKRAARMVPGRSVQDELQPVQDGWKPLRQWTPYELANYRPVLGRRFIQLGSASTLHESSEVYRSWVFDAKGDAVLVYRLGFRAARYQHRLEKTLRPPDAVASFGELRNVSGDHPFGGLIFVTTTGVFHAPDRGEGVQTVCALNQKANRRRGGGTCRTDWPNCPRRKLGCRSR
jgi:hypothetical protein